MCGLCRAVLQPSDPSTEVREDVDVREDTVLLEAFVQGSMELAATGRGKGATTEVWEEG